MPANSWDVYFHRICVAVSKNSKCLSRQIGAILVRDKSIVATSYNGPPVGIPHCDSLRRRTYLHESTINLTDHVFIKQWVQDNLNVCPRTLMGFTSGKGVDHCIAAHAERNLLNQCARLGIATKETKLYMSAEILPCKECFLELIQAGINEVVCVKVEPYEDIEWLMKYSDLSVREFYL